MGTLGGPSVKVFPLLTQINILLNFVQFTLLHQKITLKSYFKSITPNGVVAYRISTQCSNRLRGGGDGDWLGSGVGAVGQKSGSLRGGVGLS